MSTGTAIRDGFKTIRTFDGVDPKKTATVLSAGGGQHLYYAYAGELKSTTLGEGVDFLAENRMVIAPGSVRADGKPYLFVNGHDLSALAPLPGSILAKLKRSAGQQRLDTWSAKIEATPEGERHRCRARCLLGAGARCRQRASWTRPSSAAASPTWRQPACRRWTGSMSRTRSRARCARCAPKPASKDKPDASPAFTLPDFEPADEPVGDRRHSLPTSPT